MKKMKVLLITQEFSNKSCGGAGVYAFEMAKALSKDNLEIHVLAPNKKTFVEKFNDNLIIHWQKTIFKPFIRVPSFYNNVRKNFKNIIKENEIDIIHSNSNAGYFALGDLPLITTIHHMVSYETENFNFIQRMLNKIDIYLEKKMIQNSNKIISVSHLTRDLLIKEYSFCRTKIKCILEGVDTDLFRYVKKNTRKKYVLNDKEILIFFPGGARGKRKGAETAFNALKMLKDKGIKFKCIISGDSREMGWKKDFTFLIGRNNLNKELILLGELSYKDLPKYYSSSDVIIFPSLFEGFGIPTLEAMACRKPIIASKTGEAPNIIKDGENGFLVNLEDKRDLFNKIKILIDKPKLRNSFGIQGEKLVRSKYSWNKIASEYIKLYGEVLREHNKKLK